MTTAAADLARLKELAGKAGQSIFERLGLVKSILADKGFVVESWGDESKALDFLETEFFGDLCGARSLPELLIIREEYTEDIWKKYRWNLSRLLAEWDKSRPRERGHVERVTKKDLEEVKLQLAEERHVATRLRTEITVGEAERDNLKAQNKDLRERVAALERENLTLTVRLEELERLLDKMALAS